MDRLEQELRNMLKDKAAGMPPEYDASPEYVGRVSRRRSMKIVGASLAAVVMVGGIAAAIAHSTETKKHVSIEGHTVPSVGCGVPDPAPHDVTSTPGAAKSLAFYTSDANAPARGVLAPVGWTCKVVGAGMTVQSPTVSRDLVRLASCPTAAACTQQIPPGSTAVQRWDTSSSGVRDVGAAIPTADGWNVVDCYTTSAAVDCNLIVDDYVVRNRESATPTTAPRPTTSSTIDIAHPMASVVACPMSLLPDRHGQLPYGPPDTAPRGADGLLYAGAQSFVFYSPTNSPLWTVFAPKDWTCSSQMFENGSGEMTVGSRPGDKTIQVSNDWLWHGDQGAGLACTVFDTPALHMYMTKNYPSDHCLSAGRKVSMVSSATDLRIYVANFTDADGTNGAAVMTEPSGANGSDGTITVVTCKPGATLTATQCAAVIGDFTSHVIP